MQQRQIHPVWEVVIRQMSRFLTGALGVYVLDEWLSWDILFFGPIGIVATCYFFGLLCEMAGVVYLEPLFLEPLFRRGEVRRAPTAGPALWKVRLLLSFCWCTVYLCFAILCWFVFDLLLSISCEDVLLIMLIPFAVRTFALALRREYRKGIPSDYHRDIPLEYRKDTPTKDPRDMSAEDPADALNEKE